MKLMRKLDGRDVQITHGLAESLAQLEREPPEFRARGRDVSSTTSSATTCFDDGKLVVAHAGHEGGDAGPRLGPGARLRAVRRDDGRDRRVRPAGRYNWAAEYRGKATVVYGHTPVPEPEWLNRTINIDTGCVFGGRLTALRWPEQELVSVPARRTYCRAGASVPAGRSRAPALTAQQAHDDLLDIDDVRGKRIDRHAAASHRHDPRGERDRGARGHEPVRRESEVADLSAADDVAVGDERRPTDCSSIRPRRSPTSARNGVPRSCVEEKHMGSRAVVIVCRDDDVARERFGVRRRRGRHRATRARAGGSSTTSRWSASSSTAVRRALEASGFWERLGHGLGVPRLRADALVGEGAGAAAAAVRGRSAQPRASDWRETVVALAASRLRAVSTSVALLERHDARVRISPSDSRGRIATTAGRSTSLADIRLAPFHVLATEGAVHVDKDHVWHMDTIGSCLAAAGGAAHGDAVSGRSISTIPRARRPRPPGGRS